MGAAVETDQKREGTTRSLLVDDLRSLGIERGDLLHAKVSMHSIGWVEGGADAVLQAVLQVLGPQGTLVSDAFVAAHPLPLSREAARRLSDERSPTYAGAFCTAMIEHPDMVRSRHPIQKGVAIGALAERLMLDHTADSPAYDPLHELAQAGAKHISIGRKVVGVGTTHVAQNLLGLRQRHAQIGVNYRDGRGEVVLFRKNWAGGCGNGFPRFIPLYREQGAILAEGRVGRAWSMVTDMGRTLEVELERLRQDATFFLCDDPACVSCRLTWEFSTGTRPAVYYRWLRRTLGRGSVRVVLRELAARGRRLLPGRRS